MAFERDDLSGQTIGTWKVLEFDHMEYYGANGKHGMSYYRCECKKCGAVFLKARSHLTQQKNSYHQGCTNRHGII